MASKVNSIKQFCADLADRGLIASLHPAYLSNSDFAAASALPDVVYAGFDPTAPSLHFGHLIVLANLFRATLHGCHAIALVGRATARVGDPSGHTSDRLVAPEEVVDENANEMKSVLENLCNNFTSDYAEARGRLLVVDNADWHLKMSSLQFLDICRNFRVGEMLRMGTVKARMRSGVGLSCAEFLYQIFQSYDWYRLSRDYNCYFQVRA
ncbi:unnamed protein product [Gongylonema pulchrum]|uniref:Tyrosine--tRNA ligase n=1 Tax=Gongylonema pulchrum TaxID=637853 RepID=A0A3P6RB04_9BILA|nr:unnamed protein product [Gongylonema pulchrum]